MKKIGIITDSHSSISPDDEKKMGIRVIPMPFFIDDECYYENITVKRDGFFHLLENSRQTSTSQVSPKVLMDEWDRALEVYDEILYFPLSSALSSSCMNAMTFATDRKYRNRVFVVDNGRISTPMHRSVLDALEMIDIGMDAAQIKKVLEDEKENMVIYLGVQTLDYLRIGGRITPAAAALGAVLNIKPLLRFSTGKLDLYKKCRGFNKTKKMMLKSFRNDIETRFKDQYESGNLHILAATSADREESEKWVREIENEFPGHKVMFDYLSLGVCCHTGPGCLGIGLSCTPEPLKK